MKDTHGGCLRFVDPSRSLLPVKRVGGRRGKRASRAFSSEGCGGPSSRVGAVLSGRKLGALLLKENGLNYLKKKRKKEITHSSIRKYCIVLTSLVLGPDRLDLIPGSSLSSYETIGKLFSRPKSTKWG